MTSVPLMAEKEKEKEKVTSVEEEEWVAFPTYASLGAEATTDLTQIETDSVVVEAGSFAERSVVVTANDPSDDLQLELVWSFTVEAKDVKFWVIFKENGSDSEEMITSPMLILSTQPQQGWFPIKRSGVFILKWDNTYSYFTRKRVQLQWHIRKRLTLTAALKTPGSLMWNTRIHGWMYRLRLGSVKRSLILSILRRVWGVNKSDLEKRGKFDNRFRMFLTNNSSGQRVLARLSTTSDLSTEINSFGSRLLREVKSSVEDVSDENRVNVPGLVTSAHGHFRAIHHIPVETVAKWSPTSNVSWKGIVIPRAFWLCVEREDTPGQMLVSRIEAIMPEGVSVISDIDDTIKLSEVSLGKRRVFENVFMRDADAIPGTSALYNHLRSHGIMFHYVSNTPYQLHGMLHEFFRKHDFPRGSFHLKTFNFSDHTRTALLQPPEISKREALFSILKDFPHRKFILIGDSGEKDPELYAATARVFPGQVLAVVIRRILVNPKGKKRPTSPSTLSPSSPSQLEKFSEKDIEASELLSDSDVVDEDSTEDTAIEEDEVDDVDLGTSGSVALRSIPKDIPSALSSTSLTLSSPTLSSPTLSSPLTDVQLSSDDKLVDPALAAVLAAELDARMKRLFENVAWAVPWFVFDDATDKTLHNNLNVILEKQLSSVD